ncbi:calcineurin-like metallo-phosphoesterase superfamily protein isoform X2 [Wolffia australiana]
MSSLSRLTLLLCCGWAVTLLYGEMITYWLPLWTCSWPRGGSTSSLTGSSQSTDKRVNIAVLADPQIMDWTSLNLPRESMTLKAAKFFTDLYLRRSLQTSILPFKPDVVLFLGDQFDGGPFLSDKEWEDSLSRFKHIFYLKERGRYSDIKFYYLSGNHDIGYASLHMHHPEVISRFEKDFGLRNYRFTVQNVDFIAVDAQTLDGPVQGKFTSSTWEFVHNVSIDPAPNSKVLLTHIPLHRPDGTPCGPHRASSVINQRVSRAASDEGITYQNYLTRETSEELLKLIKPHTLGTMSWQQGNLYPSFMLLSVFGTNATQSPHVSTSLCFLPWQTHIYLWYLGSFVITLLLVALWPSNRSSLWDWCVQAITSLANTPKEKDDDDDGEYDMVWDAEGSMHLVKRAASGAKTCASRDAGPMGRGSAVARSAAKKHQRQEVEASVVVDMKAGDSKAAEIGSSGRSTVAKAVVRRTLHIFRMLSFVAAVNLPLYVMLLFKDWI